MAESGPDRTLTTSEIERMVSCIRPEWRVRERTFEESGHNSIYHLTIETPEGSRECVLKAADPEHPSPVDIATEARYLAVFRDHVAGPLPEIFGAVDEHETLRAPFFLMERLPGSAIGDHEVGTLSDAVLRRLARDVGCFFARLHAIENDAFHQFGDCVTCNRSPPLAGERPSGDPSQLVCQDGYDTWHSRLREWTDEHLEQLAETRFSELTARVEAALYDALDALPASFEPTLSRVDQTPANILLDPDEGTVTAMLDWEMQRVHPPAYDLAVTEFYLTGGPWMALPSTPDRRSLVKDGLLAGYREEAAIPEGLPAHRDWVHLDALVLWLTRLERGDWSAVPSDKESVAAEWFQTAIQKYV